MALSSHSATAAGNVVAMVLVGAGGGGGGGDGDGSMGCSTGGEPTADDDDDGGEQSRPRWCSSSVSSLCSTRCEHPNDSPSSAKQISPRTGLCCTRRTGGAIIERAESCRTETSSSSPHSFLVAEASGVTGC